MKKWIHPTKLPWLTLGFGGIGLALRFWLVSSADEAELLRTNHPSVILVWLLTAIFLAAVFLYTRPLEGAGKYRQNFPASLPAALCCWAVAVLVFLSGMGQLMDSPNPLGVLAGIFSILAGPCMALAGYDRFKGNRTSFLYHTVLCLAFTGQILSQYRHWSSSPALQSYCFQMLATIGLMLTAYHRAEFDARLASRRRYAFVNLATLYLCCLAVPEADSRIYYLVMAAWLFTNLCDLRPARKRVQPAEAPAPAEIQEPRQEES